MRNYGIFIDLMKGNELSIKMDIVRQIIRSIDEYSWHIGLHGMDWQRLLRLAAPQRPSSPPSTQVYVGFQLVVLQRPAVHKSEQILLSRFVLSNLSDKSLKQAISSFGVHYFQSHTRVPRFPFVPQVRILCQKQNQVLLKLRSGQEQCQKCTCRVMITEYFFFM